MCTLICVGIYIDGTSIDLSLDVHPLADLGKKNVVKLQLLRLSVICEGIIDTIAYSYPLPPQKASVCTSNVHNVYKTHSGMGRSSKMTP